MSSPAFRRGREAVLAAAGELDVREQVEAAGLRVLRQSGPWLFHQCPRFEEHARGDRNPSAQSNVETGFWQCFGCEARGRWPGFHGASGGEHRTDETPEVAPVEPFEPAPTRETRWEYTDELGNVVFWISRGSGKEFRPYHTRRGTTVVGLTEYRPLYRLAELIRGVAEGRTVYVVEGEKDVESLRALGEVATCSVGGAGKFGRAAELERLKGATVVVVADRDKPGIRHALDVRRLLEGVAASVEVVLPALGKDVSDHLHNGLGLDDLVPYEEPRLKAQTPGEPSLEPWGSERRAVLEWDTEVEYVPVQWLWRDWVVRGNLNVLAGDGGVGKTHFAVGLAARLSRGDVPGDHQGTPGRTLYLSAEDDFASHLKRLYRAAGGVPGRFGRMKVPAGEWLDDPSFPDDLPELRRLVREGEISLLVIDPGAAFFSVRDSHNDQQMRSRVFSPLASIAMGENVTVLYLAHLNKGGGTFRQRINGAVGISNAPRSVIGMARDPDHDDRNIVAHVKGNLAKPPSSLVFEFVEIPVTIDGQHAPATMLKLVGTTGQSADDLVAPKERETKADAAAELLREALADGPVPSAELQELAGAYGLSAGTLQAARAREGVVSRRRGKGWEVGYPHQFDGPSDAGTHPPDTKEALT